MPVTFANASASADGDPGDDYQSSESHSPSSSALTKKPIESTWRSAGLFRNVRRMVSGARHRLEENVSGVSFDLDFSFIADGLAAMGFPGDGIESLFRNDGDEVAKWLGVKYPGCYRIWNLSEKLYDYAKFDGSVIEAGWPDHHAPPINLLSRIVNNMVAYVLASPGRHINIVHCKAGKGRTGTVVAAILMYLGLFHTCSDALSAFLLRRGEGLTSPSQYHSIRMWYSLLLERNPALTALAYTNPAALAIGAPAPPPVTSPATLITLYPPPKRIGTEPPMVDGHSPWVGDACLGANCPNCVALSSAAPTAPDWTPDLPELADSGDVPADRAAARAAFMRKRRGPVEDVDEDDWDDDSDGFRTPTHPASADPSGPPGPRASPPSRQTDSAGAAAPPPAMLKCGPLTFTKEGIPVGPVSTSPTSAAPVGPSAFPAARVSRLRLVDGALAGAPAVPNPPLAPQRRPMDTAMMSCFFGPNSFGGPPSPSVNAASPTASTSGSAASPSRSQVGGSAVSPSVGVSATAPGSMMCGRLRSRPPIAPPRATSGKAKLPKDCILPPIVVLPQHWAAAATRVPVPYIPDVPLRLVGVRIVGLPSAFVAPSLHVSFHALCATDMTDGLASGSPKHARCPLTSSHPLPIHPPQDGGLPPHTMTFVARKFSIDVVPLGLRWLAPVTPEMVFSGDIMVTFEGQVGLSRAVLRRWQINTWFVENGKDPYARVDSTKGRITYTVPLRGMDCNKTIAKKMTPENDVGDAVVCVLFKRVGEE